MDVEELVGDLLYTHKKIDKNRINFDKKMSPRRFWILRLIHLEQNDWGYKKEPTVQELANNVFKATRGRERGKKYVSKKASKNFLEKEMKKRLDEVFESKGLVDDSGYVLLNKNETYRRSGIYFAGNKEYKFIKIGMSSDIDRRLSEVQTGCPFPIELIRYAPFSSEKKAKSFESKMHKKFATYKTQGEWFLLSDEIYKFILHDNQNDGIIKKPSYIQRKHYG